MNASQLEKTGALAEMLHTLPSLLPAGLHRNMDDAAYHARQLGVASKSALDEVHRSPAHYRAWLDGADKETPAMAFGKLAHTAVLEPHKMPEPLTKKASEDTRAARAIGEAVRQHPLSGPMLRRGDPEVVLRWDDEETGAPCKARLDWYDPKLGLVFDLKTTSDASAREFARSCANFRYHVQAAMYLVGLRALDLPADHFVFVAVEKTPPYAVAVYSLEAEDIARGAREMRRDLSTLVACCATGKFPSYPDQIQTIALPAWSHE